jgi:molybdopterin-guanine dinucleotide biosynthesis protein A
MLTVVIQAGGESRRMGRDKALIPFLGRPLIERVISRVEHLADEILVTTNRPQDYKFLGLPLFPDMIPDRGALGGLYTALQAARQPLVAVVACDMPFVQSDLLAYERDLLQNTAIDAAIPKTEGGTEPFHAVYRRDTCLPEIRSAIQAEKWRVDSWFSRVNIYYLTEDEISPLDPRGLAFNNVNTPEELAAAELAAADDLQ